MLLDIDFVYSCIPNMDCLRNCQVYFYSHSKAEESEQDWSSYKEYRIVRWEGMFLIK